MFDDFKKEDKTEDKKQFISNKKLKQLYKIILVGKNYIVIDENGNGRRIDGDFSSKKIGDSIELDI